MAIKSKSVQDSRDGDSFVSFSVCLIYVAAFLTVRLALDSQCPEPSASAPLDLYFAQR